MTQSEFNQWWQDYAVRFPSTASWFARVQSVDPNVNQVEHQRRILRTWFDVLKDAPLADALEVNARMQRGDLEAIGGFDTDKEKTPNVVRREAKQIAWEREERLKHRQGESYARVVDNFPAGKILRRIIELRDRGVSDEESKAMAYREFDEVLP